MSLLLLFLSVGAVSANPAAASATAQANNPTVSVSQSPTAASGSGSAQAPGGPIVVFPVTATQNLSTTAISPTVVVSADAETAAAATSASQPSSISDSEGFAGLATASTTSFGLSAEVSPRASLANVDVSLLPRPDTIPAPASTPSSAFAVGHSPSFAVAADAQTATNGASCNPVSNDLAASCVSVEALAAAFHAGTSQTVDAAVATAAGLQAQPWVSVDPAHPSVNANASLPAGALDSPAISGVVVLTSFISTPSPAIATEPAYVVASTFNADWVSDATSSATQASATAIGQSPSALVQVDSVPAYALGEAAQLTLDSATAIGSASATADPQSATAVPQVHASPAIAVAAAFEVAPIDSSQGGPSSAFADALAPTVALTPIATDSQAIAVAQPALSGTVAAEVTAVGIAPALAVDPLGLSATSIASAYPPSETSVLISSGNGESIATAEDADPFVAVASDGASVVVTIESTSQLVDASTTAAEATTTAHDPLVDGTIATGRASADAIGQSAAVYQDQSLGFASPLALATRPDVVVSVRPAHAVGAAIGYAADASGSAPLYVSAITNAHHVDAFVVVDAESAIGGITAGSSELDVAISGEPIGTAVTIEPFENEIVLDQGIVIAEATIISPLPDVAPGTTSAEVLVIAFNSTGGVASSVPGRVTVTVESTGSVGSTTTGASIGSHVAPSGSIVSTLHAAGTIESNVAVIGGIATSVLP